MNLNKFNIGDTVHVSAKIVGVRLTDEGKVTYTLDFLEDTEVVERAYYIPESLVSKVF